MNKMNPIRQEMKNNVMKLVYIKQHSSKPHLSAVAVVYVH